MRSLSFPATTSAGVDNESAKEEEVAAAEAPGMAAIRGMR